MKRKIKKNRCEVFSLNLAKFERNGEQRRDVRKMEEGTEIGRREKEEREREREV